MTSFSHSARKIINLCIYGIIWICNITKKTPIHKPWALCPDKHAHIIQMLQISKVISNHIPFIHSKLLSVGNMVKMLVFLETALITDQICLCLSVSYSLCLIYFLGAADAYRLYLHEQIRHDMMPNHYNILLFVLLNIHE